jgi:tryptophanyl-tRNA synthetase
MALDDPGQKMSKSDARPLASVELTDPPELIAKKLRSAVTDSGREVRSGPDKPALSNLLAIFSLFDGASVPELEARFAGSGYGEFKAALVDVVVARLQPIRERYSELMADQSELDSLLRAGAERAAEVADRTLTQVRERVGLLQNRVISGAAS